MSEHPVSTSQSVPRTSDSQWRSYLAYAAWIQALIATGGSLYFSGAMGYIPCTLCWYQRTMMYPLALIIAAGIWLRESRLRVYVLPLCLIGWLVAFYHVLLQYGIISEELSPCVAGVSCTTEWINWFGFITIPLLSFTAFSVITFCMVFYQREEEINDHEDK